MQMILFKTENPINTGFSKKENAETRINAIQKGEEMEKEKEEKKRTERVGTCRFCYEQRWVEHIEEDASQETINEIASLECDCIDAKRARELSNSVEAVKGNIDRNMELLRPVKEALKACLEPIAAGEMVKASFRIDDLTTATVCIKQGRLTCVQTRKEDIIVDEIGGR